MKIKNNASPEQLVKNRPLSGQTFIWFKKFATVRSKHFRFKKKIHAHQQIYE